MNITKNHIIDKYNKIDNVCFKGLITVRVDSIEYRLNEKIEIKKNGEYDWLAWKASKRCAPRTSTYMLFLKERCLQLAVKHERVLYHESRVLTSKTSMNRDNTRLWYSQRNRKGLISRYPYIIIKIGASIEITWWPAIFQNTNGFFLRMKRFCSSNAQLFSYKIVIFYRLLSFIGKIWTNFKAILKIFLFITIVIFNINYLKWR